MMSHTNLPPQDHRNNPNKRAFAVVAIALVLIAAIGVGYYTQVINSPKARILKISQRYLEAFKNKDIPTIRELYATTKIGSDDQ